MEIGEAVKEAGANMLRGGAFKPQNQSRTAFRAWVRTD